MDISCFDAQLQQTLPLDDAGVDRLVAGRLQVSKETPESELREYFSQYLGQRTVFALLETECYPSYPRRSPLSVIRLWESELYTLDTLYPGYTLHPAPSHNMPSLRPPPPDKSSVEQYAEDV